MIQRPQQIARRAMTLAEVLMALTILAMVSTAVLGMIQVAGHVNTTVTDSITSDTEVESAIARILGVGRTCNSMTVPSGTSPGTTFSMTTQNDAANANQTYDITYTYANNQLQETQYLHGTTNARFTAASSILVHNVQAFSVNLKPGGGPQVAVITINVGGGPQANRTFRVTPRNQ